VRSAAEPHVPPYFHEVLEARRRERRSWRALHTAQRARRCAGGGGAGAAGCCAQRSRSAAPPRVAPHCQDVLEARRRERRSGGALCASQRARRCACVQGAGAAGCCAQRWRSVAALHVAPRCHDVLEARRRERRSGGALCASQRACCCAGGQGAGAGGCCAQHRRSAAALYLAPRCHDVTEAHGRERCSWRALCVPQLQRA
jgi:hypothetical protein